MTKIENLFHSGESFEVPGLTYVWKKQGDDFGWFIDAEASRQDGWVQDSGGNWIYKLPTGEGVESVERTEET